MRYFIHYWPGDSTLGKLKIIGLLITFLALIVLAAARDLRHTIGCRLLLSLIALRFVLLAIMAVPRYDYYLVHVLPYYAIAVGIASSYLWSFHEVNLRLFSAAALIGYFTVQGCVTVHRALIVRAYQNEYLALITYLQSAKRPDDLIAGSAELGFGLGFFNPQVTDDVWLGYWFKKRPSLVVLDRWYYRPVIETALLQGLPTAGYFRTDFVREFCLVHEIGGYRVYSRRERAGTQ